MGKQGKSGKKVKTMFQCDKCDGVSKNKKDVCKPHKISSEDLSKKDMKRKPCKD